MRLLALLQEFPFPPNNGMRSDISRRLAAMHALGHQVHAIAWTGGRLDPAIGPDEHARMAAVTASLDLLRVDRGARRVAMMARLPSQTAGRWPPRAERSALLARVRERAPALDLVWVDGIHAAALGRWLADELGVPLHFRSHNVEHRYAAEQARLASGRNRVLIAANALNMGRFERATLRRADVFHDISCDDLAFWRTQGFANGRWLPPLADPAVVATAAAPPSSRSTDLLFLGSLSSPNNVAGLRWYVEAVHPRVRAAVPDLRVLIAGRRPGRELAAMLDRAAIPLLADPPDAAAVYATARVMLNPILHGSGVNIKTVDMLATGQPVVTTAKGARGLPDEVVAALRVADGAEAFAAATVAAVRAARAGTAGRDRQDLVGRVFGPAAVASALSAPADR